MSSVPYSAPLAERMQVLLERISYKVVQTEREREDIYRLRYRAYLKEGAILYHASERVHDHYDDLPNAKIVAVYVDGELAASIRVHIVSTNNSVSPVVETFGDLINPHIHNGNTIIDPNRFVSNHSLARRIPDLPYATLRIPFMAAKYYGAQILTATVRKEHQAFYRRLFHYTLASEPRIYPTLIKPLSLMIAKFGEQEVRAMKRYPFLAEYRQHEMVNIFSEATAPIERTRTTPLIPCC